MAGPTARGLTAFLAALVLQAPGAAAEEGAAVGGVLTLDLPGTPIDHVRPLVVYLEPLGDGASPPSAGSPVEIRQRAARFTPGFQVVRAGQRVEMPNDDMIYHNVFSYSPGNEFDLGTYAGGESRSVVFGRPGVVKMYCSIHESMNGTVFVAPTPWFAEADGDGRFEISPVPAGRYRLVAWSAKLPRVSREIVLRASQELSVEIPLVRRSDRHVGTEKPR